MKNSNLGQSLRPCAKRGKQSRSDNGIASSFISFTPRNDATNQKSDVFTHFDQNGKAQMVDIKEKKDVFRQAIAKGSIKIKPLAIALIRKNQIQKGDVLSIAKIAGIAAAKKTSDLIPLCHPLLLTKIDLSFKIKKNKIEIESIVECVGKTGVEMEALTAVSIAALTIYDMCKAVDKNMVIGDIYLWQKSKTLSEDK